MTGVKNFTVRVSRKMAIQTLDPKTNTLFTTIQVNRNYL